MIIEAHAVILIVFFFFNDTATTEIYTLSLHDALPIYGRLRDHGPVLAGPLPGAGPSAWPRQRPGLAHRAHLQAAGRRSEEHTSELQSRQYLVCRLLLEKKKQNI